MIFIPKRFPWINSSKVAAILSSWSQDTPAPGTAKKRKLSKIFSGAGNNRCSAVDNNSREDGNELRANGSTDSNLGSNRGKSIGSSYQSNGTKKKRKLKEFANYSSIDLTVDDGGAQGNDPDDDYDIEW